MKGEVIMNFKEAKTNMMKGIGKHSTLISFVVAAVGVGATIWFASKEIPKAKTEVKEILAKEDLTTKQKTIEVAKTVAKNCWKTAAIACATVLLVTGTSAITAANTAATVAGLTNTIQFTEQKLKDYKDAVDEIPDKKVKEEVKNSVAQKAVNRATDSLPDEYFAPDERCPLMYNWVDDWTGVTFKATMDMVETAAEIIETRFGSESYQTVHEFYKELQKRGAIFDKKYFPSLVRDFAWKYSMDFDKDVYVNTNGWTIHTIHYATPSTDF